MLSVDAVSSVKARMGDLEGHKAQRTESMSLRPGMCGHWRKADRPRPLTFCPHSLGQRVWWRLFRSSDSGCLSYLSPGVSCPCLQDGQHQQMETFFINILKSKLFSELTLQPETNIFDPSSVWSSEHRRRFLNHLNYIFITLRLFNRNLQLWYSCTHRSMFLCQSADVQTRGPKPDHILSSNFIYD